MSSQTYTVSGMTCEHCVRSVTEEVGEGRRGPTLRIWEWERPAVVIGSFQSLQHKAVDVYVQVELSRSVLHHAIGVCENAPSEHDRAVAVARAKNRCSEAGLFAVKQ